MVAMSFLFLFFVFCFFEELKLSVESTECGNMCQSNILGGINTLFTLQFVNADSFKICLR